MSTNVDSMHANHDPSARGWTRRSNWLVPALALVLGIIALLIQMIRGDTGSGIASLAIMLAYAGVLVLFSGRSETTALLRGDTADERAGLIQLRALSVTAMVLVNVLVLGFFVELARGGAALGVWSGLCVVGGVTFGAALAYFSRTS